VHGSDCKTTNIKVMSLVTAQVFASRMILSLSNRSAYFFDALYFVTTSQRAVWQAAVNDYRGV
ncbi:MAG: hypothetical protein KGS46_20955, partial [Chloroflexi bacterium]|nr:hypothetical protein [Chloroflexota bacterium]